MPITRNRSRSAFRSRARSEAGSSPIARERTDGNGSAADWRAVEELLSRLAGTRAMFPTANSSSNWISAYEPGRRLMLESGEQSGWVQVEHIRTCWDRFERLGRISRPDVLEPGRRSAFMIALFQQLPGVRWEERYLVLPPARHSSGP